MHRTLINLLVDPLEKKPLTLHIAQADDSGNVIEGELEAESGEIYKIEGSIPRFVRTDDAAQKQTEQSFGFKWEQENTYGSPAQLAFHTQWMSERYGFENTASVKAYFSSRNLILDAGCGSGYSLSLLLSPEEQENNNTQWVGADISTAINVAYKRLGHIKRTHFIQGDILQLPFPENSFDMIVSEGVLHHTPSTEQALKTLVPLIQPGGEFLFYVYRKKGAIREFTDDYIRDVIADMPPKEAWEALLPLTKLGEALANLNVEVDVPEDIPYLGIKAGKIDVQRFIYWHVAKMFWNNTMSFEENHHINFDWYHPRYAHRQTETEIRQWCEEAGLTIHHFHEQESGYTVRAIRK